MRPECDHGVVFDEVEAAKVLAESKPREGVTPAVDFILGPTGTKEIRRRWPRLHGPCPKGCGFQGIAYASYAHYLYGDW